MKQWYALYVILYSYDIQEFTLWRGKMVLRLFCLHNGISFTGKIAYLDIFALEQPLEMYYVDI